MVFGAVAEAATWPIALVLVAAVVWVPSFLHAFACVGLALDEPPPLRVVHPTHPVTVVLTSWNQPARLP
jgi:biofilm PGA synthesis N-glycosyltransferase PgaC